VEHAIRDKGVLGGAGIGFQFTVTPTSARNGAGIAEIESPFSGVDSGAGEFVTPDEVGESVNGRSPTVEKAENQQSADS
jgi:hypothetical protein